MSGMKIYQKLIEVPVSDSCLLPKDQLFWPEGRTGGFHSLPGTPDPKLHWVWACHLHKHLHHKCLRESSDWVIAWSPPNPKHPYWTVFATQYTSSSLSMASQYPSQSPTLPKFAKHTGRSPWAGGSKMKLEYSGARKATKTVLCL